MDVAPQTVVVSWTVMVVAGMVKVPVLGNTVTEGVGSSTAELVGATLAGAGAGEELASTVTVL